MNYQEESTPRHLGSSQNGQKGRGWKARLGNRTCIRTGISMAFMVWLKRPLNYRTQVPPRKQMSPQNLLHSYVIL